MFIDFLHLPDVGNLNFTELVMFFEIFVILSEVEGLSNLKGLALIDIIQIIEAIPLNPPFSKGESEAGGFDLMKKMLR